VNLGQVLSHTNKYIILPASIFFSFCLCDFHTTRCHTHRDIQTYLFSISIHIVEHQCLLLFILFLIYNCTTTTTLEEKNSKESHLNGRLEGIFIYTCTCTYIHTSTHTIFLSFQCCLFQFHIIALCVCA
jgi:hypothetical protein